MDSPTLSETMEQERQRLNKVLESIAEKRVFLDQEERAATIELHGIQAYLDAKMGKVMVTQTNAAPKKRGPTGPRGPRKTGIKDKVIEVITAEGISKQDILAKLGAGEDKTMQQAISNALVALKKDGKVASGERGMYMLPPPPRPVDTTPKRVKKDEAPAT
jgi:hypothetical protein